MSGNRKCWIEVKRGSSLSQRLLIMPRIQICRHRDGVVNQRQWLKLYSLFCFRQGFIHPPDSAKIAGAVNEMYVRDIRIELQSFFEMALRLYPIPIVDRE